MFLTFLRDILSLLIGYELHIVLIENYPGLLSTFCGVATVSTCIKFYFFISFELFISLCVRESWNKGKCL